MIDNQIVGKTIADLRTGANYTQLELAALMNVTHQAVSKWETGAALPDVQTLLDLSKLFHVSMEHMLKGDAVTQLVPQPTPEPVPEKSEGGTEVTWELIRSFAAFLGTEQLGALVDRCKQPCDLGMVRELACFLDERRLGRLLNDALGTRTETALPESGPKRAVLSPNVTNRLARRALENEDWEWFHDHIGQVADPDVFVSLADHVEEWADGDAEDCPVIEALKAQLSDERLTTMANALLELEYYGTLRQVAAKLPPEAMTALAHRAANDGNWAFFEEFREGLSSETLNDALDSAIAQDDDEGIDILTAYLE